MDLEMIVQYWSYIVEGKNEKKGVSFITETKLFSLKLSELDGSRESLG